jgi:uroporphyrinogen-III synthase
VTARLDGKYIINTRAVHQAEALNLLLRDKGAIPLNYPCIAIIPPQDQSELDAALADLTVGQFDWLILTSSNTVVSLSQRIEALELNLQNAPFKTAAIGPATAEAAKELVHIPSIDHLPADYVAEALAQSLPILQGTRIFLPESSIARSTLTDILIERGAEVCVVDAYQTVCGHGGVVISEYIAKNQIDAITFTSSSTVICFGERLNKEGIHQESILALCVACIGPKTAATAYQCGFQNVAVASENTLDGLLAALERYFAQPITFREP